MSKEIKDDNKDNIYYARVIPLLLSIILSYYPSYSCLLLIAQSWDLRYIYISHLGK